MQTLSEKENALLLTVALPDNDDWRLPEGNDEVIKELNEVLVAALEFAKAGDRTWGDIAEEIFPALAKLDAKHSKLGILESDGYTTVARFFAINLNTAIYDYLRYYDGAQA
ncbi:hypothetical protein [Pseudomonas serbica]|uniref:hypothetical protein n=1 Tax=Pseudomonas serbica TaxID=2965074 RepID=UPI00237B2618|nr:hypothetical protein [Pseudomonas serbica]